PGSGAEDGAAAGHPVELHHALGYIVGVMIGQRDHAGAELDALGPFAGGGQEHFRRGDHFPARGMVLAAPELVEAERVDLFDEIEVAAELQQRILADRVMRGEKRSEFQACHGVFSPDLLFFWKRSGCKLRGGQGQRNARSRAASTWLSRKVGRHAATRNSWAI